MGTGTSALVSILACAGGDEVELEPEEAEAPIKPVRVTTAKGMYGFKPSIHFRTPASSCEICTPLLSA